MLAAAPSRSDWHPFTRPDSRARVRLFCFPHAGGSAGSYRSWQDYLPDEIEVCAVQLPGRGFRIEERPFDRLSALTRSAADALMPLLDVPFAFFGHSMGALIAFELARHLRRQGFPQPSHLFASGFRAPHVPDPKLPIRHLPEADFIAALRKLGGTPESVLDSDDLRVFLPALRADISLCETYCHGEEVPLACPITAFGGSQDKLVPARELEAWAGHTAQSFERFFFPGDHFFLQQHALAMLRIITRQLRPLYDPCSAPGTRTTSAQVDAICR
ncbi:MAG TPA: alpha/beta fold hydrolase [Longimicrobium sp.]|jgi:medium-chain acyl-[acyl-carrier-protein] hydrolase